MIQCRALETVAVKLPKTPLEYSRRSFNYMGAKLYNSVAVDTRKAENFNAFAKRLKENFQYSYRENIVSHVSVFSLPLQFIEVSKNAIKDLLKKEFEVEDNEEEQRKFGTHIFFLHFASFRRFNSTVAQ
jgi:hypothetical protein